MTRTSERAAQRRVKPWRDWVAPMRRWVMPDTRAERVLGELVRRGKTPGLQYVVVDAASIRFEYFGGSADLETGRPMAAGTTMMAYSMSKTITAAAVLQLVETGAIGLDDAVGRHVDRQPYGGEITVRQLLTHTSGVPNPIPLRWVHAAARHGTFDESAALGDVLRQHPRLRFPPGTKFAYSNIGYWLLGRIVEHASGESFTDYVRDHVLRRLDITADAAGYAINDPSTHAAGYLERLSLMNLISPWLIDRALIGPAAGRWLQIRDHYLNGPAFGGLVGTARGFAAFLRDQLGVHSRLFGDTTRDVFREPQRTTRGPVPMTPGWHIGSSGRAPFLYKEGGGGGFHCMMRLYPAAGIGTVVMTNATAFDVRRLLDLIDPHFAGAGR
jgi:D-alanyl-D-alanine carboxypeptidase